jgi:hypothetical protein
MHWNEAGIEQSGGQAGFHQYNRFSTESMASCKHREVCAVSRTNQQMWRVCRSHQLQQRGAECAQALQLRGNLQIVKQAGTTASK